jgi:hypothetical protein
VVDVVDARPYRVDVRLVGHRRHRHAGFTFPQFPAVLPDIAAVGGTSLHRSADGAWTEQAWGNGANSLLVGVPAPAVPGTSPSPVAA